MVRKKKSLKRKKIIVFSYEGKDNKTESQYFSHFIPNSDDYILRMFSSGATDPKGIIDSVKNKRSTYDYHTSEDLTYIFVDGDCNKEKLEQIDILASKQGKDLHIIVSNPCFEVWFLNHFKKTTKEYGSSYELTKELSKHLINYDKTKDYFYTLKDKRETAIENSNFQLKQPSSTKTDVVSLFNNSVLKEK